ncbi:MAG: hypothetical protein JWL81_2164 [Verrucomicrobiales bacterium]|nr:hypothetical protein [Verrucomicrobiales bacterium]
MNPPAPPPIPTETYVVPPQKPTSKNWLLYGCGGCLGLVVLLGIGGVAIMYFAFGTLKKSDLYQTALKRAESSPEVQAALGTPLDTGWMMQGSMKVENSNGTADLTIPLKGPKGEGSLHVKGNQTGGAPWVYSELQAILPDGKVVDLREP